MDRNNLDRDGIGGWSLAGSYVQGGLKPGDRIAIMLRNSREWVICDQAALGLDLVTVPLYTNDRPDNIVYIVEETQARLLVVGGQRQWRRLQEAGGRFTHLQRIVSLADIEANDGVYDPHLESFAEWSFGCHGDALCSHADPDQLATIVYTSGTSGRSKGVMLSHRNMLENAWAVTEVAEIGPDDTFLSFLPLSHTLERTAGYYLPMVCGSQVVFARSIQQLAEDLRAIRPTLLISVPRVYERVHARLHRQLARKPLARKLFQQAVQQGWRRYERSQQRARWSPGQILNPLLDRLVGKRLRNQLGGRLRFAICGGAPLSPELMREFCALGASMLQGYGLTEASPVVSVNHPESNRPGSIGLSLCNVEVKIGRQDELLIKGPNVMHGYWNDEEATRAAIDQDGWLHSGDQARQETNGHLYIIGRLKDIIVLANGEKVAPAALELAISMDELFDQALIVGEGRPYLTALVVVNPEVWPEFACECDVDPEDPDVMMGCYVQRCALRRIGRALREFPGYTQIRRVILLRAPWTLEQGLVTPTQKFKRACILAEHVEMIKAMYEELE